MAQKSSVTSDLIIEWLKERSSRWDRAEMIRFQCPLVEVILERDQREPQKEKESLKGKIFVLGNECLFLFDQSLPDKTPSGHKGRLYLNVVEIHYFDIVSMEYTKKNFKLKVSFHPAPVKTQTDRVTLINKVFHFRTDESLGLVASLYNRRLALGGYWPAIALAPQSKALRFDITERWQPKTRAQHFLDTYRVWCSHEDTKPNPIVAPYLTQLEQKNIRELSLMHAGFDALHCKDKDVVPFVSALWHDQYFAGCSVWDVPDRGIVQALAHVLTHNRHLTKLVMINMQGASAAVLEYLTRALEEMRSTSLQILDLRNNKLQRVDSLMTFIERYSGKLTYLNLAGCGLNGQVMSRLIMALMQNKAASVALRTLNLGHNLFDLDDPFSLTTSNQMRYWLTQFGADMALENLCLAATKCSIKVCFEGVKCLRNLTALDISMNEIKSETDSNVLTFSVASATKLNTLKLANMYFDLPNTAEGQYIERMWGKPHAITLDLSHCSRFAPICSRLLQNAQNLTELNLSHLGVSEPQFDSIVNTLQSLRVRNCNLNSILARAFQPASPRSIQALLRLCTSNHQMDTLALGGFGLAAMRALFQEWTKVGTGALANLDISSNHLGNEGVPEVAYFLMENKTLKTLTLDDNEISYVGWSALYHAMFYNITLEKLTWSTQDLVSSLTPLPTKVKDKRKQYQPAPINRPDHVHSHEQTMRMLFAMQGRMQRYEQENLGFIFPSSVAPCSNMPEVPLAWYQDLDPRMKKTFGTISSPRSESVVQRGRPEFGSLRMGGMNIASKLKESFENATAGGSEPDRSLTSPRGKHNETKLGGGRSAFLASMSSTRQIRDPNAPPLSQQQQQQQPPSNSNSSNQPPNPLAGLSAPQQSPRLHQSLQDLSPRHPPTERSGMDFSPRDSRDDGSGGHTTTHVRERKTGVSHGKNTVSPIAKQVQAAHQERERERLEAEQREAELARNEPVDREKAKQQLQQLRDMMQQVQMQLQLKQQHPSDSPIHHQQVQELSEKLSRLQAQYQQAQARERASPPKHDHVGTHSDSPITSPRNENPNLLSPPHEMTRLQPVNPHRFTPPNPNRYTPPAPSQPQQGRVNPNRFTQPAQGRQQRNAHQYVPPNAQVGAVLPTGGLGGGQSSPQSGSPHNSGRLSLPSQQNSPHASNVLHQGSASGRYTPPNRSLSYVNSNKSNKRPSTGGLSAGQSVSIPDQILSLDASSTAPVELNPVNSIAPPELSPTKPSTPPSISTPQCPTPTPEFKFSDTPVRSPSHPTGLTSSAHSVDSSSGDFQPGQQPGGDKAGLVPRAFPNRRPMSPNEEGNSNSNSGASGGVLNKRDSDPSNGAMKFEASPVSPRPGSQREWKTRLTDRAERQNNSSNTHSSERPESRHDERVDRSGLTTSQNGNGGGHVTVNSRANLTASRGEDRSALGGDRPNSSKVLTEAKQEELNALKERLALLQQQQAQIQLQKQQQQESRLAASQDRPTVNNNPKLPGPELQTRPLRGDSDGRPLSASNSSHAVNASSGNPANQSNDLLRPSLSASKGLSGGQSRERLVSPPSQQQGAPRERDNSNGNTANNNNNTSPSQPPSATPNQSSSIQGAHPSPVKLPPLPSPTTTLPPSLVASGIMLANPFLTISNLMLPNESEFSSK